MGGLRKMLKNTAENSGPNITILVIKLLKIRTEAKSF